MSQQVYVSAEGPTFNRIHCDQCGRRLKVPMGIRLTKWRCPHCGFTGRYMKHQCPAAADPRIPELVHQPAPVRPAGKAAAPLVRVESVPELVEQRAAGRRETQPDRNDHLSKERKSEALAAGVWGIVLGVVVFAATLVIASLTKELPPVLVVGSLLEGLVCLTFGGMVCAGQRWAIYGLLVIGYLNLLSVALSFVAGQPAGWLSGLIAMSMLRAGHKALGHRN